MMRMILTTLMMTLMMVLLIKVYTKVCMRSGCCKIPTSFLLVRFFTPKFWFNIFCVIQLFFVSSISIGDFVMTLRDKLAMITGSELMILINKNKPIGMRAKLYNTNIEKYEYYDFVLSDIKDESMREYINAHKNLFENVELVSNGAGLLVSLQEVKGDIVVSELKNPEDINGILEKVVAVYKELIHE